MRLASIPSLEDESEIRVLRNMIDSLKRLPALVPTFAKVRIAKLV